MDFSKSRRKKEFLKKLVGFEIESKGIPRNGYEILNDNHQIIGTVTSGILSPTLKKGIGVGNISIEHLEV